MPGLSLFRLILIDAVLGHLHFPLDHAWVQMLRRKSIRNNTADLSRKRNESCFACQAVPAPYELQHISSVLRVSRGAECIRTSLILSRL